MNPPNSHSQRDAGPIDSAGAPVGVLASGTVLGVRVDAVSRDGAIRCVLDWAQAAERRYVCAATVHSVMEGYDDEAHRTALNDADLVTADGMPIVWALRLLGVPGAARAEGPALTPEILAAASEAGIPVGFYGGRAEVLARLLDVIDLRWPGLRVVYHYSPPFRRLTPAEDGAVCEAIEASGARIVFVFLGCPKQERWMAAHTQRVHAVLVGVGAALDITAGVVRRAPPWMQRAGLEWLYRLLKEPRRLWRRYVLLNPRFVAHFSAQLLGRVRA